jgi:hypothetical protein
LFDELNKRIKIAEKEYIENKSDNNFNRFIEQIINMFRIIVLSDKSLGIPRDLRFDMIQDLGIFYQQHAEKYLGKIDTYSNYLYSVYLQKKNNLIEKYSNDKVFAQFDVLENPEMFPADDNLMVSVYKEDSIRILNTLKNPPRLKTISEEAVVVIKKDLWDEKIERKKGARILARWAIIRAVGLGNSTFLYER